MHLDTRGEWKPSEILHDTRLDVLKIVEGVLVCRSRWLYVQTIVRAEVLEVVIEWELVAYVHVDRE